MYIILEAHHRFADDAVVDLWSLIGRIYAIHPKLMHAVHRPDIAPIVQITLAAWQKRYAHLQQRFQHSSPTDPLNEPSPPPWLSELRRKFEPPAATSTLAPDATVREPVGAASPLLPLNFDFDSIDWSLWADLDFDSNFDPAAYEPPA